MAITREEVARVAALANLRFTEAEIEVFTAQFQRILGYIEKLSEVDVAGVEPTSHASVAAGAAGAGREDRVRPSLPVEEALAAAPDAAQDHFRVPKVL